MKRFAIAAVATVGLAAISTPADAAIFEWTVEYTDFWADGASLTGSIHAEEEAALDGIISSDEFTSWMWNWSGNIDVDPFSISSQDEFAETQFDAALILGANPFVEGLFIGGTDSVEYSIDFFDSIFVTAFDFEEASNDFLYEAPASESDQFGTVTTSAKAVPEPATVLGLIALAATASTTIKRQKQGA